MTIRDFIRRSDHVTRIGLIAWAVMICAVTVHTLLVASAKNVTPVYRAATERFLRGEALYPDINVSINGFLYLPGFATLYIPFDLLGPWLGDAAWKATGVALLTWAAWLSCQDMQRDLRIRVFALACLISIPVVAGSFLQGQANIHLGAACWLATLAAFRGRTGALIVWSGLAILAKPVAIVSILLIGGVKPRTIPALAAGIAWAVALPFAAANPHYVAGLYGDVWTMLTAMAVADRFDAADFTALFSGLGLALDLTTITAIRLAAALATWAAALWFAGRLPHSAAALGVTIAGAAYMCLFNPRAEGLTYAILALPCALVIAAGLYEGRARTLWATAAGVLVLVGSNGLFPVTTSLAGTWYKPALFVLLFALMAVALLRPRDDNPQTS